MKSIDVPFPVDKTLIGPTGTGVKSPSQQGLRRSPGPKDPRLPVVSCRRRGGSRFGPVPEYISGPLPSRHRETTRRSAFHLSRPLTIEDRGPSLRVRRGLRPRRGPSQDGRLPVGVSTGDVTDSPVSDDTRGRNGSTLAGHLNPTRVSRQRDVSSRSTGGTGH